ncbi:LysR family transcriptional regulator [Azotosporobacter soli]|uniref:LysR family transcriptional regulator n=1 Tax=Azotosporobacter soli TaxID=3055040 RepID=UPI0031FE673F
MNLRQMRYILAIAEEQNLSAAAKKLYIAQPSLSQLLQKVEEQLGTLLFDRSATPLRPTYAGELYLSAARKTLDLSDQLRKQLDDIDNLKQGRITLGISPFRSIHFLPRVLPTFQRRYPGIEVRLLEGQMDEIEAFMAKGVTDLSLMTLPVQNELFAYEALLHETILAVLPSDHRLCRQLASTTSGTEAQLPLSALRDEPFILLKPGQRMRQFSLELCRQAGFTPRIVMETENIEAAHALAAAGLGVTLAPDTLQSVRTPTPPCYASLGDPPPSRTLVIAYRKNAYLSQAAQAFIAVAQESVGKG